MKNICREFAQALDSSNKNVESKRLALYEERSTIARELHDSIAQSLAFSRIQITLLNNALNKGISSEKTNKILDELNLGIQTAYKQLRSVLTTFRMKPESSDLRDNILTALDQFKERSGIPFTLQNEMQSFELGANQQIHLLQIIREALTNIEKHARAQHVFISIQNTGNKSFRLTVRDDGIGISFSKKDGHYGLEIMAERAKVLGGSLSVHSVIPHGTEVTLDFTPIV